jgi:hypothetical protein
MRVTALAELQAEGARVVTLAILDGVGSPEHVIASGVDLPSWLA